MMILTVPSVKSKMLICEQSISIELRQENTWQYKIKDYKCSEIEYNRIQYRQRPCPSSDSPAGRPAAAAARWRTDRLCHHKSSEDTHLSALDSLHDAGELRHVLGVRHGCRCWWWMNSIKSGQGAQEYYKKTHKQRRRRLKETGREASLLHRGLRGGITREESLLGAHPHHHLLSSLSLSHCTGLCWSVHASAARSQNSFSASSWRKTPPSRLHCTVSLLLFCILPQRGCLDSQSSLFSAMNGLFYFTTNKPNNLRLKGRV